MKQFDPKKAWPRLHVSDYMRLSSVSRFDSPTPDLKPLYRVYAEGVHFEMLVASCHGDSKMCYGLVTQNSEHSIKEVDLGQIEYLSVETTDTYLNRDMEWKSGGRTLAEIYKGLTGEDWNEIS